MTYAPRLFIINHMKKRLLTAATVLAVALCAAMFIIVYFVPLRFSADETADRLWREMLPRAALGIVLFVLVLLFGYKNIFALKKEGAAKDLLWCLPCLAVALANFPYSALIAGTATIIRTDLIWLFLLKCLLIAVSEELLFRGILLSFFKDIFNCKKHSFLLRVTISSAVFALFHLLNLAEGAAVGATLMQVGYTFLTGLMFAAVTERTGSIWLAIVLHFIFDIGGLIVPELGVGLFQDTIFWIITAVCAAVCALHLIIYAIKTDSNECKENFDENN